MFIKGSKYFLRFHLVGDYFHIAAFLEWDFFEKKKTDNNKITGLQ